MAWLMWKPVSGSQLPNKTNMLSPSLELNHGFKGRVKSEGKDIGFKSYLQVHGGFTSAPATLAQVHRICWIIPS